MTSFVLTPRTSALVLAYVHRQPIRFLPGRLLAASHLRCLSTWIGVSSPHIQTIRAHPILAAHLALLQAAGLLAAPTSQGDCRAWSCRPAIFDWLQAEPVVQLDALLQPLHPGSSTEAAWQTTLEQFGLAETLPIDQTAFLQQTIQRQQAALAPVQPGQAEWLAAPSPDEWNLSLPDTLPTAPLFHLLQLGEWQPGQPLSCTPLTISAAMRRGYTPFLIESSLVAATGQPLDAARQAQLLDYWGRLDSYRVEQVYLLTTKQPGQLAGIAANRRLAARFHRQLSPRHAIVSPDLIPSLRRWLDGRGYLLNAPGADRPAQPKPDVYYSHLALSVLAGLAGFIELPLTLPAATGADGLTAAEQAEAAQLSQAVLDGVRQAISGRDAFFPADTPANSDWLALIQQAIAQEQPLDILYQSPGDPAPRQRRIEPLRLYQRGELHYLEAYCYLAEANRVFRLDRLSACEPAGEAP
jgi:hypothetical protein